VTLARRGHTLHRFSANADSLEFSPDGRLLASGGHDHYLRVMGRAFGPDADRCHGAPGPVEDVSFSPDGRWLVTAGPISAGVWSVATGTSASAPARADLAAARCAVHARRTDHRQPPAMTERSDRLRLRVCGTLSNSCTSASCGCPDAPSLVVGPFLELVGLARQRCVAACSQSFAPAAASDHVSRRPNLGARTWVVARAAAAQCRRSGCTSRAPRSPGGNLRSRAVPRRPRAPRLHERLAEEARDLVARERFEPP
jgi:hypothetical protein